MRDKLVELIQNAVGGCARHWAELIADQLMANGVTIQQWIPVSESLPEPFVSVLGYMPDEDGFPPVRECYYVEVGFYFPALAEVRDITHWMPMPSVEGLNDT